MKTVFMTKQPV